MTRDSCGIGALGTLAAFILVVISTSAVFADQLTITFVGANFSEQVITLDCDSPTEQLALAANLLGEDGVHVEHELVGRCSLAEIASAMTTANSLFAASVAQTLSILSPGNTAAIVTAVNAVPGVNTVAVLSAVHFGPYRNTDGPQSTVFGANQGSGIGGIEINPSNN